MALIGYYWMALIGLFLLIHNFDLPSCYVQSFLVFPALELEVYLPFIKENMD